VHSGGQNLKFSIIIKNAGKNKTKIKKKIVIFKQNQLSTTFILVFGANLKHITVG